MTDVRVCTVTHAACHVSLNDWQLHSTADAQSGYQMPTDLAADADLPKMPRILRYLVRHLIVRVVDGIAVFPCSHKSSNDCSDGN